MFNHNNYFHKRRGRQTFVGHGQLEAYNLYRKPHKYKWGGGRWNNWTAYRYATCFLTLKSVFQALLWNATQNTRQIMYVPGRHQYVRCNPLINAAPAHSNNNLNTLALDGVPFIQRKSLNSKGLLHLYFQILIKTWKPFGWHTPAEVFPTRNTWQRRVRVKNLQNYKPIPLLLQTPYCLVDTLATVTK